MINKSELNELVQHLQSFKGDAYLKLDGEKRKCEFTLAILKKGVFYLKCKFLNQNFVPMESLKTITTFEGKSGDFDISVKGVI